MDAANPLVFVKASDLGLTGKELPSELDNDPEKLELLEKVRGMPLSNWDCAMIILAVHGKLPASPK